MEWRGLHIVVALLRTGLMTVDILSCINGWMRDKESSCMSSSSQVVRLTPSSLSRDTALGWIQKISSIRHPVTRAVAHLCIITSDANLNIWGMENNWDVEILEDGVRREKPATPPCRRTSTRPSGSTGSALLQDCEQNQQM